MLFFRNFFLGFFPPPLLWESNDDRTLAPVLAGSCSGNVL